MKGPGVHFSDDEVRALLKRSGDYLRGKDGRHGPDGRDGRVLFSRDEEFKALGADDLLRKNFNWTQAAWLQKQFPGQRLESVPDEKLVAKMAEWRQDHPDAKAAAEAYPLPEGFLNNSQQLGAGAHSADLARSLGAYEEQTGGQAQASDIDGFRAAVKPLVEASEKSGLVFSAKLLDLVGAKGGEHSVVFTPGRVLKFTEPDTAGGVVKFASDGEPRVFHGTAPEYVHQIEQNRDLIGDSTQVEGVMKDGNGTRIVTSQKAERGAKPTYAEAAKAFMDAGFMPVDQEMRSGQTGTELWWNRDPLSLKPICFSKLKTSMLDGGAHGECRIRNPVHRTN